MRHHLSPLPLALWLSAFDSRFSGIIYTSDQHAHFMRQHSNLTCRKSKYSLLSLKFAISKRVKELVQRDLELKHTFPDYNSAWDRNLLRILKYWLTHHFTGCFPHQTLNSLRASINLDFFFFFNLNIQLLNTFLFGETRNEELA